MSEESGARTVIGKGDARYWMQKGKLLLDRRSRFYSCKLQVAGRRESFPLRTSNKSAAAGKAAKIFTDVVALGWDAAVEKHKPKELPKPKGATVGDLIAAVSELAQVRPATLRANVATFRRIVSDIEGIDRPKGRFGPGGKERKEWLGAVDGIRMAAITPDRVEAWKLRYVADRARDDESQTRNAKNSANTMLRMGKSLLAKRLLRFVSSRVELPTPLPFDGVEPFPRQSMRYVSKIDAGKLVEAAENENLIDTQPEVFKAFILCLFAGLRRNEADKLRWSSVDFESREGSIQIEAHHDFAPKAETSLGEVPLDPEVCALLRGLRARDPGAEYVLAGGKSKTGARWSEYRAEETFSALTGWLREKGVKARTPLHELRKEAGSIVCSKHGLFAASRFLRHADVAITAQHYAAQKDRVTFGFKSLMEGEEPQDSSSPKKAEARE